MRISWTEARVRQLKMLHRLGLSFDAIAERMGGTASAIHNKCVKLRLKRLDKPGFSTPADYGYGG